MVADFITGNAEAVVYDADWCQLGLVNRQLCGCAEGSHGGL